MITNLRDFIPHIEPGYKSNDRIEQTLCNVLGIITMPEAYGHEFGHTAMAKLLHLNTKARIRVFVSGGGASTIQKGPASWFGRCLGPKVSQIMIEGAGPAMNVIYAIALLTLGLSLDRGSIQGLLCSLAIGSLCGSIGYAGKGIWRSSDQYYFTSNDFAELKKLGIHPIFPLMGMIAVLSVAIRILFGRIFSDLN